MLLTVPLCLLFIHTTGMAHFRNVVRLPSGKVFLFETSIPVLDGPHPTSCSVCSGGGGVLVVEEAEARSRSLASSGEVTNGCSIRRRGVHKDNYAFMS